MISSRYPNYTTLRDEIGSIEDLLDGDYKSSTLQKRGVEAHAKLRKVKAEIEDAAGILSTGEIDALKRSLHRVTERVLVEVFGFDITKEVPVTLTVQPTDGNMAISATDTYSNDDIAGVTIRATAGRKVIEVSGTAKRAEGDKPDRAIGLTLAHGRALRKLGNQLIVEANEAVRAADAERRRERAKADQERAKNVKGERKVRAERTATVLLAEVQKELRYLRQTADEQRENANELHTLVEELSAENEQLRTVAKQKDYAARIATRRANQAAKPKATAKKAPAKKAAAKR